MKTSSPPSPRPRRSFLDTSLDVLALCLLGGLAASAQAPVPGQIEDPRAVLERYPPLTVSLRTPHLEESGYFPCSDCHDNDLQLSNPRIRVLEDMHDEITLDHGGGRFWCLTCHHDAERDSLASLKGHPISFDDGFLLCGQCHFQRQRDFFEGAHGKRLESWRGPRKVVACTECHDPHRPVILAAPPYPPPELRSNLVPVHSEHPASPPPWARIEASPGSEAVEHHPDDDDGRTP